MAAREYVNLDVAGREVRVSSPNKVFFPKRGETKLDLIDYYLAAEALSHAWELQGDGQGRAGHGRADLKTALDELRGGLETDDSEGGAYSIVVEFAEGCTAQYPPVASGTAPRPDARK